MNRPVFREQFGLEWVGQFLSEEAIEQGLGAARACARRAFADGRALPGSKRAPGCITGLDEQPTTLVNAILTDLPPRVLDRLFLMHIRREDASLTVNDQRRIIFELLLDTMLTLRREYTVYYLNGEWCAPQSFLDIARRGRSGSRHPRFIDDRSWHGHPRSHRNRHRRLGIAPGTSTAVA